MLKRLLNQLIDKLQATFPVNRLVVLATPILFIPASAAVTGWVALHFPGLEIPEGLVVGLSGAAALGALTLAYKWLDQWQHGENIGSQADIEAALEEFADSPDVADLFSALGSLEGIGHSVGDLRARMGGDAGLTEAQVIDSLGSIGDAIAAVLHEHSAKQPSAINAAVATE